MFEESDIFEITDYTTASDWERFISDFEEVIRHWNLTPKQPKSQESTKSNNEPEEQQEIKFSKVAFTVTYYNSCTEETELDEGATKCFVDMMNVKNDFPSRAHCICRYYGFKQFIVLSVRNVNDSIYTQDKAKLVLSAVAVALGNTNCVVPVFLQLHQWQRRLFQGIIVTPNTRSDLEMVHFRETPKGYGYLSELVNLFKEKLACPLESCPPIKVSARLTHLIRKWPESWSNSSELSHQEINLNDVKQLKFNCNQESLQELQLSTTWPSLSEQMVSDSEFYSDLNPLLAPQWTCRLLCNENCSSTLTDSLFSFINLKSLWSENDTILGKVIVSCEEQETEVEVKQALNKLANRQINISLPKFTQKIKLGQSQSLSKEIISYIFNNDISETVFDTYYDFRSFKSSPYNGVVWKLSVVLCHVYHTYRDLAIIANIWKDLVNELRRYWESSEVIPGFEDTNSPNLLTCLLHQKLELLSCCIQQKKKREAKTNQSTEVIKDDPGTEEEDEFFDCVEEVETGVVREGEGRAEKHSHLLLLETGEPLYIPITQEPTPMTEDMLQEQSRIFSQLGTSSEGSQLRARMQGANLLSDMEAFKAANPGAILEDFVRWHSPKDYIEADSKHGSKKGQLSVRMQHSGNIWRELWDSARAVPAMKQKRLFDYTKEAEKFLHYLASFNLTSLVNHMMPVLIHCSVAQLLSKRNELELTDSEVTVNVVEITRHCCNGNYDHCLGMIQSVEKKLLRIISLRKKLEIVHNLEYEENNKPFSWKVVKQFVLDMINEPEVKIPGNGSDYFGILIKRLFMESNVLLYEEATSVGERDYQEANNRQARLPAPAAKEFILRVTTPYPSVYSKELPQRFYCVVANNEFRIATALTEDTVYF